MRRGLGICVGLAACIAATGALAAGSSLARFQGFAAGSQSEAEGWSGWSPREEIAPKFSVDRRGGRSGRGALRIRCERPNQYGGWRRRVEGISGGRTYRFSALYRTEGVRDPGRSVGARLDWLDEAGKRLHPPAFAAEAGQEGGWTRMEYVTPAPEKARSVEVTLSLAWSPQGTAWWDDIQVAEESSPRQRVVRAMTVFHRPRGTRSAAESVEQFCDTVEASAAEKPDVVCLPEGITVVGTGKKYLEVSEPVPGPTTRRLGELARKLRTYVVAGVYERVGDTLYNTAVLIDRKGELVGRYRKTHLPAEEVEAGITPGDSYPVFDTDFGRVGLTVCWDLQFPEPCRAMALKGAEVILLPIWGGSEVLARARAIENHVFMITSSYDMKTFIVNPAGEVLAEATPQRKTAVAELHLDRKIMQPWLGDMKPRTFKERRPDLKVEEGR